ncbi:MAG: universal stress protein [Nitrospirales bacterium]|nr:MAG: universal stress protein [Nitrospirales bacterium]
MKILCAVDGSEFSLWALECVGKLFRHSVKELVLWHAVDPRILRGGGGKRPKKDEPGTKDLSQKLEAAGQKVLKDCAHRMEMVLSQATTKPFAAIKTALVKGHAADSIISYAERTRPDLVVVGSRGMNDLPGYLLGSISRTVLTHAPCSVLTVKSPLDEPASVLLALDGSKPSKFAANRVKEWLSPEEVTLHLVSVVPDILTDASKKILPKSRLKALVAPLRKDAQEYLEQYRELFLKEGFQVVGKRLQGNPREKIVESVSACHAQLVVMGSKGLTGVERFTMGSVSEWVSAYAPSSVLVVRH